jgi:hypothetical protein
MAALKANFLFFYIFVLNLADAVLTHYSVGNKLATEQNPLMDYLLEISPSLFYICKLILVVLGLVLLKRLGRSPGTQFALVLCAAVYTWIMTVHYSILG